MSAVSNVIDLGYSFKPVAEPEFLQALTQARVMHHNLPLNMRKLTTGPGKGSTIYLAGEDPVGLQAADGQRYIRAT